MGNLLYWFFYNFLFAMFSGKKKMQWFNMEEILLLILYWVLLSGKVEEKKVESQWLDLSHVLAKFVCLEPNPYRMKKIFKRMYNPIIHLPSSQQYTTDVSENKMIFHNRSYIKYIKQKLLLVNGLSVPQKLFSFALSLWLPLHNLKGHCQFMICFCLIMLRLVYHIH